MYKYSKENKVYYFSTQKDLFDALSGLENHSEEYSLMYKATTVINTLDNSILKSRYSLEDIFDKIYNIKNNNL